MTKKLKRKLYDKIEELGWEYVIEDDGLCIRKGSPAGEDFGFYIAGKDIVAEVEEYAIDFDCDEHVSMWVEARNNTSGVPSIRELVYDADRIKEMLGELSIALCETREGE